MRPRVIDLRKGLFAVSIFLLAAAGWLAGVAAFRQYPHYQTTLIQAAGIAVVSLTAIAALQSSRLGRWRRLGRFYF